MLGRHVQVHIPDCVVTFIHGGCPKPVGVYTRYRGIDDEGNKNPCSEESFENVLPQERMDNLNFESGVKVKVCVSFENTVYPISCVCTFINELSVSGWILTFVGKEYTNAMIFCDTVESWDEVFFYCMQKVDDYTSVVYHKVDP